MRQGGYEALDLYDQRSVRQTWPFGKSSIGAKLPIGICKLCGGEKELLKSDLIAVAAFEPL